MADDPYTVLGVSRGASDDEIRDAYRKLAKSLHPDMNPDDQAAEEKFKNVSAAFRILGDQEKRARFDRGEIDASGQQRSDSQFFRDFGRRGGTRYRTRGARDEFTSFSDIFSDLFGADDTISRERSSRGRDRNYTFDIEFLEAALGAKKRIVLSSGGTLDLNVPAGVADGQTLRLKGKGDKSTPDGAAGDALIEITVKPHPFFEREGDDIQLTLPVTIDEAIIGAKVNVPTISGPVALSIPKGSNTGKVLRLKGKGIENSRTGATGDQFVRLSIQLPDHIDDELHNFIESWRENNEYNPRRKLGG